MDHGMTSPTIEARPKICNQKRMGALRGHSRTPAPDLTKIKMCANAGFPEDQVNAGPVGIAAGNSTRCGTSEFSGNHPRSCVPVMR
jgi:hypothetical protein